MASEHSLLPRLPITTRLVAMVTSFLFITACDVSDNGKGGFQASDPVAVDYPIAYVERTLPVDEDGEPAEREVLTQAPSIRVPT